MGIKVNLGAGRYPQPGYLNIDIQPPADVIGDFREMTFTDVDEVRLDHVLEHFSWTEAPTLLRQWASWLKPDGLLHVEVPDMRAICEDPEAETFQRYAYGCHKNPWEYHQAGYTLRSLSLLLMDLGYYIESGTRFKSDCPSRVGMPCLIVKAHTPRLSSQDAAGRPERISSPVFDGRVPAG